jgi:hypothetical protein
MMSAESGAPSAHNVELYESILNEIRLPLTKVLNDALSSHQAGGRVPLLRLEAWLDNSSSETRQNEAERVTLVRQHPLQVIYILTSCSRRRLSSHRLPLGTAALILILWKRIPAETATAAKRKLVLHIPCPTMTCVNAMLVQSSGGRWLGAFDWHVPRPSLAPCLLRRSQVADA